MLFEINSVLLCYFLIMTCGLKNITVEQWLSDFLVWGFFDNLKKLLRTSKFFHLCGSYLMACWSQIVLACKSWLCTSLPDSEFSEILLLTLESTVCTVECATALNQNPLPHRGEPVVKHLPAPLNISTNIYHIRY